MRKVIISFVSICILPPFKHLVPHMYETRIWLTWRSLFLIVHVWYICGVMSRLFSYFLPSCFVLLTVHLYLHTVHMCRRVKSLYIITRNPRQQVDKAPAHQCPPEVLHTISPLCPPIVIYGNYQAHITAQILNHAGGGSEKPSTQSVNCWPLWTTSYFHLRATVCSLPSPKSLI